MVICMITYQDYIKMHNGFWLLMSGCVTMVYHMNAQLFLGVKSRNSKDKSKSILNHIPDFSLYAFIKTSITASNQKFKMVS